MIPKVLLHLPQNGLWPKNGQTWPKTGFLAKYGHFWPIWSNAWPLNNSDKLPRWFFRYVGTKTFTYSHKNWDKWPNLAFLAKYWHFWSIGSHSRPKTMGTRCLGGFSVTWVPKLLLPPVRIRIFSPKRPNLVQHMHFWSFWARYWHFWPIWSHVWPKNNANKMPRWFFRYVGSGYQNFCFLQ